jgi:hypothetical protein
MFDKENTPRKIAESTGRLPPTPMEKTAVKMDNVIKFGAPPAAIPNTPVMKRVRLNEILSRSRRTHYILSVKSVEDVLSTPYICTSSP